MGLPLPPSTAVFVYGGLLDGVLDGPDEDLTPDWTMTAGGTVRFALPSGFYAQFPTYGYLAKADQITLHPATQDEVDAAEVATEDSPVNDRDGNPLYLAGQKPFSLGQTIDDSGRPWVALAWPGAYPSFMPWQAFIRFPGEAEKGPFSFPEGTMPGDSVPITALIPAPGEASGTAVGPAGDSAYQVAVDNGFVGSQEDWLASLVGPQGEQGETGPQGDSAFEVAVAEGFEGTEAEWLASLVGPQGEQGETGETGPTGATGATGATGPAGTSVWLTDAALNTTIGGANTNIAVSPVAGRVLQVGDLIYSDSEDTPGFFMQVSVVNGDGTGNGNTRGELDGTVNIGGAWGSISGTLTDQEDLTAYVAAQIASETSRAETAEATKAARTTTISTSGGITGGGDLSADRTLTIADGALTIAKTNVDGGTDIGADLADGDEVLVYDASATANRKSAITRIWDWIVGYTGGSLLPLARIASKGGSGIYSGNTTISDDLGDIDTSISALTSGAWTAPSYANGWVDYASATYAPLRIRSDRSDVVRLQGIVSGTGATGSEIFVLPTGYRPLHDIAIAAHGQSGSTEYLADIIISSSGTVTLNPAVGTLGAISSTPNWLSFSHTFSTSL